MPRLLPIWIGAAQGNALALRITGEATPRPVTSDLMAELLRVTGARVERVAVTSLREQTFYAVIAVAIDGRIDELDARPSDALNLAVRVGAPIFVDDGVIEQAALPTGDLEARLKEDAEKAEYEVPCVAPLEAENRTRVNAAERGTLTRAQARAISAG